MSGFAMGIAGFGLMLALIALRAPIGLSMLVVGALGYTQLSSFSALFNYMKTNTYHQFSNYTLSVIPLFILMGALAERAGIAAALFKAAEGVFGRMKGGVAMSVIGACTAFGAICGSSVATTATFGRAALPELAALIPGLMAAVFYCLVIALLVRLKPDLAPPVSRAPVVRRAAPLWQKLFGAALLAGVAYLYLRGAMGLGWSVTAGLMAVAVAVMDRAVMPALLVAFIVVGGIYGGVFTPTEGAAVGCIAMLAIGWGTRQLGWQETIAALKQTAETSGMIFMILLGAEVFGAFLALSRLPTIAAETISLSGWSPMTVLIAMLAFYIILGAVMDELAMILLTLPVFFPVIQALDFGMFPDDAAVWFGILVLIVVGIGLTCPPIGLNVFVIASIAKDVPLTQTYRGVLPFIVADVLRLGLVLAFPGLALWLVRALS